MRISYASMNITLVNDVYTYLVSTISFSSNLANFFTQSLDTYTTCDTNRGRFDGTLSISWYKQLPFTSIVLANFPSQNRHRRETYLYSACLSRSCFYVVLVCVSYSVALVVQACGPFFHLRSPCCFVTRGVSLHQRVGPGTEATARVFFSFLFFYLFICFSFFFFLFFFSFFFFFFGG